MLHVRQTWVRRSMAVAMLLVSLTGVLNYAVNIHVHIDAFGHATAHAHPYGQEDGPDGATRHTHARCDMLRMEVVPMQPLPAVDCMGCMVQPTGCATWSLFRVPCIQSVDCAKVPGRSPPPA